MKSSSKRKNKFLLSPIIIGIVLWVLFAFSCIPVSVFKITYVHILLLAAPLFLIPTVWIQDFPEIFIPKWAQLLVLPLALVLAAAFLLPTGVLAALLALPWLLLCVAVSVDQIVKFIISAQRNIATICILMAFVYLPVGAAWAFADRLAFYPFDFPPTITLLTAAHFHYAGFLLPIIAGLILQQFHNNIISKVIGWGVILGIPLVAIGITTSHFQLPELIEVFAVTTMASAGASIGILHIVLGWKHRQQIFGWLWILAGMALLGGMTLAFLYGWRYYYPIPSLTIPWMYALHGTSVSYTHLTLPTTPYL